MENVWKILEFNFAKLNEQNLDITTMFYFVHALREDKHYLGRRKMMGKERGFLYKRCHTRAYRAAYL